jgi:hypothetical protein
MKEMPRLISPRQEEDKNCKKMKKVNELVFLICNLRSVRLNVILK